MTIYGTLIARGYFPKELPPSFFTELFSKYARTKRGRDALERYVPAQGFTECVSYRLALSQGNHRDLGIPHPASFASLAQLTSKHFRRLLKKSGRSAFARSRPVYVTSEARAVRPSFSPGNLPRERAIARAGASYLVKADVSHFYPSLYTHAIGWAIDPKLREKAHWRDKRLLGKKLDQAVMDLQGKVSQGVPIGSDISFLLAELVLADVDKALGLDPHRAYRWFDDYEISCDSLEEAQQILSRLTKELRRFRLRTNAAKTSIQPLPAPTRKDWQHELLVSSRGSLKRADAVVAFFDVAFRLAAENPDAAVLNYALGLLFRLPRPEDHLGGVLESGITQALLAEPGTAQKGLSLLSFWIMNGFGSDRRLLARTIRRIIENHRSSGSTSDVCWALAFCLEQSLRLDRTAGEMLQSYDDDCIALQALHCHSLGLLSRGFSKQLVDKSLKDVNMDGEHWLLGYEAVRQGFSKASQKAVLANPLFNDLLTTGVTFYRRQLPPYASIVHPGGAPGWTVKLWLDLLRGQKDLPKAVVEATQDLEVVKRLREDLLRLPSDGRTPDEAVQALFQLNATELATILADAEPYV